MQQWEYLTVGPIKRAHGFEGDYPYLTQLTNTGRKVARIAGKGGIAEGEVFATTIAQLGEDGWEMVGCGTVNGTTAGSVMHVLYFKRPKP